MKSINHRFDMGAIYSKDSTCFRVFAPYADKVYLRLYEKGSGDCLIEELQMSLNEELEYEGIWQIIVEGNLNNTYYTYRICSLGSQDEAFDPYATACGVNGVRSMVIDLDSTNPEGFLQDKGPKVESITDIIVTEISIADTTGDKSCNARYPGKYLGLTELGLLSPGKKNTGLSYIKELGVTHVQLMPSFDFASIDESRLEEDQDRKSVV